MSSDEVPIILTNESLIKRGKLKDFYSKLIEINNRGKSMNVFMLKNKLTGNWFSNYKKSRVKKWSDRQKSGSIWTSINGPIQAIRANNLDKNEVEIKEFELIELN